MPRRRWIKLWTQETLYGTTARELEPAERWVWLGFLALAGDSVEPGTICPAPGVAWTDKQLADVLKVSPAILQSAKTKMLNYGKITINEGIIHICNWEKYQSEYERTKKYRSTIFPTKNTAEKPTTQANVAKGVENVSTIPDQTRPDQKNNTTTAIGETKNEATDKALVLTSKFYEDNIGRLTPAVSEALKDLTATYPIEWIEKAFKEAVKLEHRNLKYIEAILERYRVEGFEAPKQKGAKGGKREHGTHRRGDKESSAERLRQSLD